MESEYVWFHWSGVASAVSIGGTFTGWKWIPLTGRTRYITTTLNANMQCWLANFFSLPFQLW